MSDLVQRLRTRPIDGLCIEAAAEIERLNRELAQTEGNLEREIEHGTLLAKALAQSLAEIEPVRKALEPFARSEMPSSKKTLVDFNEDGLRCAISPLQIARKRSKEALEGAHVASPSMTAEEMRGLCILEAMPCTAENPRESEFHYGYFRGVMDYQRNIRALPLTPEGRS